VSGKLAAVRCDASATFSRPVELAFSLGPERGIFTAIRQAAGKQKVSASASSRRVPSAAFGRNQSSRHIPCAVRGSVVKLRRGVGDGTQECACYFIARAGNDAAVWRRTFAMNLAVRVRLSTLVTRMDHGRNKESEKPSSIRVSSVFHPWFASANSPHESSRDAEKSNVYSVEDQRRAARRLSPIPFN